MITGAYTGISLEGGDGDYFLNRPKLNAPLNQRFLLTREGYGEEGLRPNSHTPVHALA